MLLTRIVLTVSILMAGLAYILIRPVHPNVEDRLPAMVFDSAMTLSLLLGKVSSKLGFGEVIPLARYFLDSFAGLIPMTKYHGPDEVQREEAVFGGVSVRIYRPVNGGDAPLAGLVFFHGGGWMFGSVASHDGLTAHYAVAAKIVVVSVEYRMAPENPFPVPFDDSKTATLYFIRNAASFGVDPERVAIGGDSAGGNIAAAISQQLLDTKSQLMPKAQILIYPVLQMIDLGTPSYAGTKEIVDQKGYGILMSTYLGLPEEIGEVIGQNRHMSPAMAEKVRPYFDLRALPIGSVPEGFKPTNPENFDRRVTDSMEKKLTNPYVSPLLAPDVSRLPQTFVFTAGGDAFRDDGAFYAYRLKKAGVKVTWLDLPRAFHGCVNFMSVLLNSQSGQTANSDIVNFLKQALL